MEKNDFVFDITNGGRIKLSDAVVEILRQYKQVEKHSMEAGGILLGRFIKTSKDIVVDKVTIPLKGDKQSRFSFKRVSPIHQEIVAKEWIKSNGTCNYLGEWHTHPENFPEPSNIDFKDWKRKLENDVFSGRYLYFVIAGLKSINVWEGDRRTLKIEKLKNHQSNKT